MKKSLVLLALLLAVAARGQEGPNSNFSKMPDLDLLKPPESQPAIEPTVIREERVLLSPAENRARWQPSFATIDQWIAWVKKPEYRLLASEQSREFYAAVFLANGRNVVLASQPLHGASDQNYVAEMRVERNNGVDAADWKKRKRLQINCILHAPNGAPDTFTPWDAGWLVPIKKGYRGPLHVEIGKGKPDKPLQSILNTTFNWPVSL